MKDHPEVDDARRFQCFQDVVDLVNSYRLEIFRVGYYISPEVERTFPVEPKLRNILLHRLVDALEGHLETTQVIPVMDGFDPLTVRMLSQDMVALSVMRDQEDLIGPLTIQNTQNLLGEVFYADSRYSLFTQMVDIVSYLRLASDLERMGFPLSDFKRRLAEISIQLAPSIKHERIITLLIGSPEDAEGAQNSHTESGEAMDESQATNTGHGTPDAQTR